MKMMLYIQVCNLRSTPQPANGWVVDPVLGDALQYAPRLRQLEVLLPGTFEEDEARIYTDIIGAHVPPSTVVTVRAGYDVGADETDFWEAASICRGENGRRLSLCPLRIRF